MYPPGCKYTTNSDWVYGEIEISKDGVSLGKKYTYDNRGFDSLRLNLTAGNYTITTMARWGVNDVKDYTVKVYSKAAVKIEPYTVTTNDLISNL